MAMALFRRDPTSAISDELLFATGLLFGAALLVAVVTAVTVLPYAPSPGAATLFLGLLLAADLVILWAFLRHLLKRTVLVPLEEIGEHAQRIAGGDYEHPIPDTGREELDRLVGSLNTMARRLIRDQRLLEENVRSLEETNQELVETTDELIRTARMASVGTLAAGIAHELGNPLGALRGALDAARARLSSGGNVEEALQVALEEARRIDQIIRSVMEFARTTPPEGAGEWVRVELADAVRGIVDLLERRGALDGARIRVTEAADAPAVRVRTQLLEQVLVNLLMNGAQAGAGESGEIEVRIRGVDAPTEGREPRREDDPPGTDYSHRRRLARIREGEPAAELPGLPMDAVVEILDRGPGIPDEHLERIFDPFFTTKPPGEGTGMGLAITGRIIQELGGELEARNREGGGALFRMTLPGASGTHVDPAVGEEGVGEEKEASGG